MTKYTLKLSESQIATVKSAMELYARLGMGQYSELMHICPDWKDERMREAVLMLEKIPNRSLHTIDEKFRQAWDIYRVVRYRLAWDRDPNGTSYNVEYNEPMRVAKEKLPEISKNL